MAEAKYSVGDKFVIEVGEVYGSGKIFPNKPEYLYRILGFNSLVFDECGLEKIHQLNDEYINEHYGMFQDAAYQKGLEDAWGQ